MIGLIDYGSGNIHAISNIYHRLNIPYFISKDHKELEKADKLILPGVGDFDETMRLFNKTGLKSIMDDLVINKGKPILGVCVGMQVMGLNSEEGNEPGLGWINGEVKSLAISELKFKPKLPHMGWNSIELSQKTELLKNVNLEKGFYFLHSYYFSCNDPNDILTYTEYGIRFASAINHKNIFGCQFHPEKSHQNGIGIFKNFAELKC